MGDWAFTFGHAPIDAREVARRIDGPLEEIGAAHALVESGGRWLLTVYATDETRDAVAAALTDAAPGARFEAERLPDENWVARSLEGLAPVRAGRFLVHGAHDRHRVRHADVAIEIEAGEAFGTGHHATTLGCLLAIERVLRTDRPRAILDLGTGSGVLAIALAKRTGRAVLASDIDPVSVRTARANARLNGVGPLVRPFAANGTDHPTIRGSAPFDLVVANILAGPLRRMAPGVAKVLAPRGTVILSGLLDRQTRGLRARYREFGLAPRFAIRRDGWTTLALQRGG